MTEGTNGGKKYMEDKKWIAKSLENHDYLLTQLHKGQVDLMQQMARVEEGMNNITADVKEIRGRMVTRTECETNRKADSFDISKTGRIIAKKEAEGILFDNWSKKAKLIVLILSILGMLGVSSGINFWIQKQTATAEQIATRVHETQPRVIVPEKLIIKAVKEALKEDGK